MEFTFERFAGIADRVFFGFGAGAEDPDAERLLLRHAGVGAFAGGDAQGGVRFGPAEGAAGVFALLIAVAVPGVVVEREAGVGPGVDADFQLGVGSGHDRLLHRAHRHDRAAPGIDREFREAARPGDVLPAAERLAREEIVPPCAVVARQQRRDRLGPGSGGSSK